MTIHSLSWYWLQIWPNLAANVLWVPVAWMHHRKVMRKLGISLVHAKPGTVSKGVSDENP